MDLWLRYVGTVLLTLLGIGVKTAAQNLPSLPMNTQSEQEHSVARQMEALTSISAQKQAESFRQQAESFRRQHGSAAIHPEPQLAPIGAGTIVTAKPLKDPVPVNSQGDVTAAQVDKTEPAAGFYTVPWPRSPDFVMPNVQIQTYGCDALGAGEVESLIKKASTTNRIEPALLRAVMVQESGLRPCAVSTAGAMGLMQIMPETADELGLDDPFDPASNVDAGAKYLKQMLDRYHGNTALALAAYNAGPGRTDNANGIPPISETIGYVSRILENIPLF
jgi:soluble lytic murein transglycosylase-like protein